MKKGLIILMAVAMLFAMTSLAFAIQDNGSGPAGKGNIIANQYTLADSGTAGTWGSFSYETTASGTGINGKRWSYREQGVDIAGVNYPKYTGSVADGLSTHPYGTWNSPYTLGIDGFNYNDSQDYTNDGTDVKTGGDVTVTVPFYAGGDTETALPAISFTSGPHGGYLTSTHRCRECHAVHRAAGKFKLLRSDTRFEACDWCHGTGAGSGFNIQMDNDDNYTTEYNVGHTMGFGISSGKWKAPDDTYPAFTPNYWMGGFSCFDCHSPHANPARIMGFDANGKPIPSIIDRTTGEVFVIGNPGHDLFTLGGKGFAGANHAELEAGNITVPAFGGLVLPKPKPYYLAGSWLLIKNPDREIASNTNTFVASSIQQWMGPGGFMADHKDDATITPGSEIPDVVDAALTEFDTTTAYPVNKVPTDWNNPIGSASLNAEDFSTEVPGWYMPAANTNYGYNVRNPFCRSLILDEFCTDCHDGNAGFHTTQAPLFSEDRALRQQSITSTKDGAGVSDNARFKGSYDLAYGHDANVRH